MANQKALVVIAGAGAVVLAVVFGRKAKAATPPVVSLPTAIAIAPEPLPAPAQTPEVAMPAAPPTPTTPKPADVKLSAHFMLSEFLRSATFPDLAKYSPTQQELVNVGLLVKGILEPLRVKYGPITITSGGRPESVAAAHGTTWFKVLTAEGETPATRSDHADFSGVDFVVPGLSADKLISFTEDLKMNDSTRQVGVYFKTVKGVKTLDHFHTAVVTTAHPKIMTDAYYYVHVDNKPV